MLTLDPQSLLVRESVNGKLGPKLTMSKQHYDGIVLNWDHALNHDLLQCCYPELLPEEYRAKHIFPEGSGLTRTCINKVWFSGKEIYEISVVLQDLYKGEWPRHTITICYNPILFPWFDKIVKENKKV